MSNAAKEDIRQWILSGAAVILVGLMSWNIKTTSDLQRDVAVLTAFVSSQPTVDQKQDDQIKQAMAVAIGNARDIGMLMERTKNLGQ